VSQGGLRQAMPVVASMVDELRATLGPALVDGLLRRAKQGAPVFYAAEVVDGQVREFGRAPSGQRVILMGGQLHWPAKKPGGVV
jgi:hypothetical protein